MKNTEKAKNKLIEELNQLKSYVTDDVWKEMLKRIKVIKQVRFVIPDDNEQAERAERIRKEAEAIVIGRVVFSAYENMGFTELSQAWQTIPEINNEFNGVWSFIHYMAKIFPNSEAQKLAKKRRPEDYPQPEKDVQGAAETLGSKALNLAKVPVSKLIKCGEGHTVEFKETLEYDIRQNQLNKNLSKECLKTIVAFLNTDGGTLLIGIKDNGEVTGIERDLPYVQRKNQDGFELRLRNLMRSGFAPRPLRKAKVTFERFVERTVCRVDVSPVNLGQVIHFDNEVYIRDGNTTVKLAGRDLTDWIQNRTQSARKGDRE